MTDSERKWIDEADYEALLRRWRFAPVGDAMFQGDTGSYYAKVMSERRATSEHVSASKRIGWDKP